MAMNTIRQPFAGVALVCCAFLFAGCVPTPPAGGDTTAPGFVQVTVRLEKPGDPKSRGDFDITSADVTRNNIPSDLVLRIQATVGDSESGITGVSLETRPVFDKVRGQEIPSNLTWKCSGRHPGSVLVPVLQAGTLPFTLAAPPSPAPAYWQVDATANPIAATGCTIDTTAGIGSVGVDGFIRLKVTNGAGLTSTSKTFIFNYADVGR
jgi:hypothetical protein